MSSTAEPGAPPRWRPLAGLRVLDLGRSVAAPFAARLLADLGAEVERLEPASGDPPRDADNVGPGSVARCAYDDVNADKRVHRVPDLAAAVQAHVGTSDILVCDLSPADQRDVGIELSELAEHHPGLVIGVVTGYGQTGPHADRPWSELTSYHVGSEAATLPGPHIHARFPDRPPVRAGRFLAGYDAGLTLAGGIVSAALRQRVTGVGDVIEVSAQEVEIGLNRTTISRGLNEGRDFDRTYEGYGWQGTLRTRDGWVCLRPNEDRHWQAFTARIGGPDLAHDARFETYEARFEHRDELDGELEAWTRTVDRETVREAMLAAGVPGAPYLEPTEVLDDPAVRSRGVFEPHPAGGRVPRSLARPMSPASPAGQELVDRVGTRLRSGDRRAGPLAGIRVLDLTWVASGPYATLLLASLGADVIKIESHGRPDLFRRSHGSDDDVDAGLRFVDLNQGKRSVAIDLKSSEGRERLLHLAATCDVLVENYRPGVRDRLGIGDEDLRARHPGLVTVSLSGFGATSVDRDRPGYASVFAAESGISTMTGYPDAPPTDVRDSNDLRGGTATFLTAVAGLYQVVVSGSAPALDVAMRDVLILLQGDVFLQASRGVAVTRSGNEVPGQPATGCYLAADDRWVAVSVRGNADGGRLDALPAMADDHGDHDHPATTTATRLERWIAQRDADDAVAELCAAGVPAAATLSVQDVGRDPHVAARGVLRDGDHPRLGPLRFVAGPIRSRAAVPPPRATSSPLLGEHTDEVLAELPPHDPAGAPAERPHRAPGPEGT